jgi:flagellar hook-associated protein 1 FlgK
MGDAVLSIGISGLNAAQAALTATSHNITNVNTPGYSRQNTTQTTNAPMYEGASGFFGTGVAVNGVQRSYNSFLQTQVWSAQSSSSQMQTMSDQIAPLDSLLSSTSNSPSTAISAFFNSVQDLASNPSDAATRATVLAQAQSLAATFQQAGAQMDAQRSGITNQLGAAVAQVNSLASQIANLNTRIVSLSSGAGSQGQQPNDLLDQRDQLVTSLSQLVNTQVTVNTDGSYNVLIGSGQPLVLPTGAARLSVVNGNPDPSQSQVVLTGQNGAVNLRDSDLTGGQIGGLLGMRDNVLNPAENALGLVSMNLAAAFNGQNQLGQDLKGAMGGNVFNVPQPLALTSAANTGNATLTASVSSYTALTNSDYQLNYDGSNYTVKRLSDGSTSAFATLPQTVDGLTLSISAGSMAAGDSFLIQPTRAGASGLSVALTDPSGLAAALPIQAQASVSNTGSMSVGSLAVNGPTADANLRQPVTITFTSPTTFNVTGAGTGSPTGLTYTPGGSISYNGWTLQLNGAPAAGDTVTLGANTNASGDNRNALLLAGLQTSQLVNGTTTLGDSYAQLVSSVGNQAQTAQTGATAQATVLSSAQQAQSSVSGVNLDEEAANLLRYQQAYQACGKVIAMAATLFNTILQLDG